ncbi:MAG: pyridoxal-phosphate dependent enzyme [Gemmatimonadota bacterium]|nr:pyridoxal-phosphate dependent enzyme [Gemmatimonadota bacterium]
MTEPPAPTPDATSAALTKLAGHIVETPVRRWTPDTAGASRPADSTLFLKLELFQRTGTFKVRGALMNILDAPAGAVERGVTAVSAGNHAIAVAYAARSAGTTAKVVILDSANPGRVARCRAYGAEIERAPDGATGFALAQRIARDEGRLFIHPFDGVPTITGTSTLGLEMLEQIEDLDAIVVPVGGGGILAGVCAFVKAVRPACAVYGVEPVGADTMRRSLDAGECRAIDAIDTVADSLGAPYTEPYGFSVIRDRVDDVVLVDDRAILDAMRTLYEDAKLSVEPASAAPYAAVCGPLRDRLEGRRACLLVSGSNIDIDTFARYVRRDA